jgi:hypothetical protein
MIQRMPVSLASAKCTNKIPQLGNSQTFHLDGALGVPIKKHLGCVTRNSKALALPWPLVAGALFCIKPCL